MNPIDQLEELANVTRCPHWCDGDQCTKDADPGDAYHRATLPAVGSARAAIDSFASSTGASCAPIAMVEAVGVQGHNVIEGLDAQSCRDIAAALLAAAERLDQIAASS